MGKKWVAALLSHSSIHVHLKSSDWWWIDIWLVQHQINVHTVEKEKEMFTDASHPKQQNYALTWKSCAGSCECDSCLSETTADILAENISNSNVCVCVSLLDPDLCSMEYGASMRWRSTLEMAAWLHPQHMEKQAPPPKYGPMLLLLFGFTDPECCRGMKSV